MTDKPGTPAVRTMRAQGLVNLVVRGLLRTPGLSRIIGSRLVTLYVVGRKSGRRYTVPVSYLAQGDDLLIGTSFGWARNLRTGEPMAFRFKGKIRSADVQTSTAEPDVVTAYAHMAAANPAFARFSRVHLDHDGNPSHRDLHLAWLEVRGSSSSRLGDLRFPSRCRGSHYWRHALPPDQHQVRPVRALTWPTASKMSGVARLMKRLTRWPKP